MRSAPVRHASSGGALRRRMLAAAAIGALGAWRLPGAVAAAGAATVAATPARAALPAAEQRRIDALLVAVAADRQSRFVRAGLDYSGTEAARFLRAKLHAQGATVRSAEDFIERIGSRSSTTGRPYRVCRAEGDCVDAGEHLHGLLARVAARP